MGEPVTQRVDRAIDVLLGVPLDALAVCKAAGHQNARGLFASHCDLERGFQRFKRFLKLIGPAWAVESAEQPPASVEKLADTNSVADLGRQPKRAVDHLESQPQISLGLRTVDLLLLALVSDLVLVQGRRLGVVDRRACCLPK